MRSLLLSTLFALALSGCQSPLPPAPRLVETPKAVLPPAPADVMVEREPNFLKRLLMLFSESEAKPTESSTSLPPVKP